MNKFYRWVLLCIVLLGGSIRGVYILTGSSIIGDLIGNEHAHESDNSKNELNDDTHMHTDDHPHEEGVLVVQAKAIEQSELSEKTYVGTIYSPYYGQVYPLREGLVEELYVDVGDTVKKGEVIGKLTAQTFAPELADMQASRQADITIAQGGVEAATVRLQNAKQYRDEYVSSLGELGNSLITSRNTQEIQDSLDATTQQAIDQANAELVQMESSLDLLENRLAIEQKRLGVEQSVLEQEIQSLEAEIMIAQQKLAGSLRFAYTLLIGVFYPDGYTDQRNIDSRFGARNTATRNRFQVLIDRLAKSIQTVESQTIEEQLNLYEDVLETIDAGILVLENTSAGGNVYSSTQLATDKDALIDAKIDDIGGLLTIGGDIRSSTIALDAKKQQIQQLEESFELQNQSILLERQQLEQEIELFKVSTKTEIANQYLSLEQQKRELSLNDLELQGRQSEIQRTIREYDQAVVEAQAELTVAQGELRGAQQAFGILQQGGYNNTIVAPFAGTITKRFITIGATVSAETPIFDIVDSAQGDDTFVRFEVPEHEYDDLEQGQIIKFLRVQDPIRHYEASIERIANAIDQESKTILVEAKLKEDYEKVLLGGTVVVMFEQPSRVFLVPIQAVFEGDDSELYVWKVVDDVIVQQSVETGKAIGDQIYITLGLNSGDTVVADALQTEGKETGDTIQVIQGFQASEANQGLDALGDGHDHAH